MPDGMNEKNLDPSNNDNLTDPKPGNQTVPDPPQDPPQPNQ